MLSRSQAALSITLDEHLAIDVLNVSKSNAFYRNGVQGKPSTRDSPNGVRQLFGVAAGLDLLTDPALALHERIWLVMQRSRKKLSRTLLSRKACAGESIRVIKKEVKGHVRFSLLWTSNTLSSCIMICSCSIPKVILQQAFFDFQRVLISKLDINLPSRPHIGTQETNTDRIAYNFSLPRSEIISTVKTWPRMSPFRHS